MAILSIDTYLQHTIKRNVEKLLNSSYIIREVVLADFDTDIRDSFVRTFCTDKDNKGTEIPVLFTFPTVKQDKNAFMLIQYKGGEEDGEDRGNLGNQTGVVEDSTGNTISETLTVQKEISNQGVPVYYLKPTHIVADVLSVEDFSGHIRVADGRIYLEVPMLGDLLEGKSFKVYYVPYQDTVDHSYPSQPRSVMVGYDLTETFTVDSVSNNMDTLRCLDALLKTILIYMRSSTIDEQVEYRLAHLVFMGSDLIREINEGTNSVAGEQLFYRRAEITYNSTYSVAMSKGALLKDVEIKNYLEEG